MEYLVCIQCSLRAVVKGEPQPTFDESPEAHRQRLHPDPAATEAERAELMAAITPELVEQSAAAQRRKREEG